MNAFAAPGLPFMKMHGLGNDFVVIDERQTGPVVTGDIAIEIADRHRGVGFDQLVAIRDHAAEDLELLFWNADGSMAGACGNATRCIAGWEMDRRQASSLRILTERGVLKAKRSPGHENTIEVDMGAPLLDWESVPLARELDTLELPMPGTPSATGMGNPHCTYFVDDVAGIDLERFGSEIEHHPLFPERTNVQVAQMVGPDHIRMRVWERGVGITLASGSSTCAVAVTAIRKGLTGNKVRVDMDGGTLQVTWAGEGVLMSGTWAHVFDGVWHRP